MAETTYDRTKPQKRFTAAVSRGLRESAVLAIGVIALVLFFALVSYHREDPAFSSTGGGGHAVGNLIGPFGAWLSDILYFLFGRPAYLFPIMLGVACFVMFRQRDEEEGRTRANTAIRIGGFTLMLFASCGLATLHWNAGTLRETAGGVVGQFIGSGLAANMNFLGATLFMLAACMAGVSLAFGVSWLTIVDKLGEGIWNGIAWIKARRSTARDVAVGLEAKKARVEAAKVEEKRVATRVKPRIEAPAPVVEKSERVEKERQVPMFESGKAGELPPLNLLDDPPVHEAHYSQEALEAMSRLVELKLNDFGIDVEVVAVQPGPVITRYRNAPGPGRQGQPDLQPLEGSRAFAVGDQRARRRSHSRQVGHGARDSEREARDRHARRNHQVQGIRRRVLAAGDRARQGHRRRAGVRRPCARCRTC